MARRSFMQQDINTSEVSLERYLDIIALESNTAVNMLETFKRVIPSFAVNLKSKNEEIKKTLAEFRFKLSSSSELNSKQKQLDAVVQHLDFLLYGETLTLVPENFVGHFPTYLRALREVSENSYKFIDTTLTNYNILLSSFISNKTSRTATISLYSDNKFYTGPGKDLKSITQYTDVLKPFFPKNTGKTRVQLKSVLERFRDFDIIFEEAKKLSYIQTPAKVESLNRKVNDCVDLLTTIIESIRKNGVDNVSPEVTSDIARSSYEMAKLVEFAAINYHDSMVALNSVDFMVNDLINRNTRKAA